MAEAAVATGTVSRESTSSIMLRRGLCDMTQCAICLTDYINPRSLPCLHTFCLQCLRDMYTLLVPMDLATCPLCRLEFTLPGTGVDGLPHNFIVGDLVELYRKDSASRLHEGPDGTEEESFQVEGIGDVGLEGCEDGPSGSGNVESCLEHDGEPLEVFCFDCRREICALCSTGNHGVHKCWEVFQVRAEFRLQITADIQRLTDAVCSVESALQDLEAKRLEVLTGLQNTEAAIVSRSENMEEQEELLEELRAAKAIALKKMETKKDKLGLNRETLSSFVRCAKLLQVEDLDGQQAVQQIIRSAKQIRAKTRRLLRDLGPSATASGGGHSSCAELLFQLPDGKPVCGLTSLDSELYVIRICSCDVAVYDLTSSFNLVRHVTVRGLQRTVFGIPLIGQAQPVDMTSCLRHHCVYIADGHHMVVHRAYMDGAGATQWPVGELPTGLSVTGATANVLVACNAKATGPKIREFTALGCLVREIAVRTELTGLRHCLMLEGTRHYVVCWSNGTTGSAGLALIDLEGHHICLSPSSWKSPCHVVQVVLRSASGIGLLGVANNTGNISLVNDSTLTQLATLVDNCSSVEKLAWNNATQHLYVADRGSVKVYAVHPSRLKAAASNHCN